MKSYYETINNKIEKKGFLRWFRILIIVLGMIVVVVILLIWWMGRVMSALPPLADRWRQVTGFGESQEYLLLFQNSAELRPTGGFLSAVGTVKMAWGLPLGLSIRDSYAVTDPAEIVEAPAAIDSLFADDPKYRGWVFRDANFSPDFPSSLQDILMFMDKAGEETEFDGVMAIDLHFLESVLGLIGPIEIDGMVFNRDTLFDSLQFATKNFDKHDWEEFQTRKSILGEMGKRIIRRVVTSPALYDDLGRLLAEAFIEKHAVAWWRDEETQRDFEDLGWAGRLDDASPILQLAVVETNLGGRKSDRYLRRDVEQEVFLNEDGSLSGNLRIRLKHLGDRGYYSNQFKGHLRVYLPYGTEMTGFYGSFPGRPDVFSDLGQAVFGSLVFVDPGEEIELVYEYDLPDYLYSDKGLDLKLWKQPGTDADFYRTVFKVPSGIRLYSETAQARENVGIWETMLDQDQEAHFDVILDTRPPLVAEQRFLSDNWSEVFIEFDEPIQKIPAERTENYEIWDEDEVNDKVTDKVRVLDAEYYDRGVTLTVSGVTDQPLERYKLKINGGILDMSGNELHLDSAEVTLVQRVVE